jgi:hypothetical protein
VVEVGGPLAVRVHVLVVEEPAQLVALEYEGFNVQISHNPPAELLPTKVSQK